MTGARLTAGAPCWDVSRFGMVGGVAAAEVRLVAVLRMDWSSRSGTKVDFGRTRISVRQFPAEMGGRTSVGCGRLKVRYTTETKRAVEPRKVSSQGTRRTRAN